MNTVPHLPTLDALPTCFVLWLLFIGLGARLKALPPTRGTYLALAVVAAAALLVPIRGLPLWSWVFSCYPNPSLPMLGLLVARRLPRFAGITFFQRGDWLATWVFGAVAGSAIYLPPLLNAPVDLYYWGWDRDHAAWILAGGAVALLAAGNRFGILLLVTLVGFTLSGLESSNCWDYVLDPVYWLASVLVLVRQGWAAVRERRVNRAAPVPAASREVLA